MTDLDLSMFEPFTKLVRIQIEGKSFEVPENNILLRCVQYIVNDNVVPGRFCWNNECGNCESTVQAPDDPEGQRLRGCQTVVQEGMALTDLTPELRYWLSGKLK
jgi:predicted molibdopterin-dependent oxidoreductase YjgC